MASDADGSGRGRCLRAPWEMDFEVARREGPTVNREPETREWQGRVEELERANRRMEARCRTWRRWGIGLAGGAVTVVLCGAAAHRAATVEAREFILRDDSGAMRAALTIRPDGTPGLGLYDRSGRVRLSVDLDGEGRGGLNLHDETGTLRAAVGLRSDGTPGVGLFGARGQVRASLDVGRDGSSGVNVYDEAGTLRAALAVRPDATPAVGLFDARGRIQRSVEASSK